MIKNLRFRPPVSSPATPTTLLAYEEELGKHLPAAFTEFCLRWNGGFPAAELSFFPVPKQYGDFFIEYPKSGGVNIDGLYGLTHNPEACNVRRGASLLNVSSPHALLPIGFDLLGNFVLVDLKPRGLVLWWDHELWEQPGVPRLIPIGNSLEHFYNSLASETGQILL